MEWRSKVKFKLAVLCTLLSAMSFIGPGAALAQAEDPSSENGELEIETTEDTIKINFPEMDLESVLKNFSALTGKSFILEQMPKGQIRTIGPIGPVEIPKDQAYKLFVLIMSLNGYSVVPTSVPGVYKVIRSAEALKENIPIYPAGRRPATSEEMITRFVPLRHLSASEISGQISQLSSKEGGQVIPYPPTNTLIILDTALNIERMIKLLRLLDVPSPEPEIEIITLVYSEPSEISGILNQVFQGPTAAPATRTATTKRPARGRRQPKPAPAPAPPSPETGLPKIIPVERINGLIVIAEADMMEAIKEFIQKLDIDVGAAETIHVYYVQNAEASELAGTLSGLAGGGRTTRATAAPQVPEALRSAKPTPRTKAKTKAASATATISGVLRGDISITSDEATNSLIIVAMPQDYAILKEVIEKLDIPRRQVFVEAVLIEVTYTDSKTAGTSIHGASPLEDDGVVFSGTDLQGLSSLEFMSSFIQEGGLPSGITIGAMGQPVEVPGTGGQVMIPSAGLLLRLLASESDVNILSAPTLLTTDNEEASIEVGKKIPMETGRTLSTGAFSQVSITRESVSIKLRLTPQINERDNIKMNISVDISALAGENDLGPITSDKTAETTVIVKDSQTIIIGGLMEDERTSNQSRVPFLGDIPVLGWLFKGASQNTLKSNLIILITPHIVKSDADVERVKERIREGYDGIIEEDVGREMPGWDRYWDSQLRDEEQGEVIDLRSGTKAPVDWEWTPPQPTSEQSGDSAGTAPQRPYATTGESSGQTAGGPSP
jgi:general secretion pathway protein D